MVFTLSLLDVFEISSSDYVDDGLFPGSQDLGQKRLNYPAGLRRKPNLNGITSLDFEQDPEDFLDQLVDEQARRRFHKQIEQQLEEISRQLNYNYKLNSRFRDRYNFKNPFPNEGETFNSPEFEYNLPKSSAGNGDVVFGLTPADPRYKVDDVADSYEEDLKHTPDVDNEQQVLFKFINPQKNPMNNFKTNNIFSPSTSTGKENPRPSKVLQQHPENNNFVMKESIGLESETNVYIVALIAGVTAAVTVGLIVLVVAWYT